MSHGNMMGDQRSRDIDLLYDLIASDDVDSCEALIKRGLDLNQTIPLSYRDAAADRLLVRRHLHILPLHAACVYLRPRILELLLKYGADPNKPDYFDITPLELTLIYWPRVCRNILWDILDLPPFTNARRRDADRVLELLCSYGAQVSAAISEQGSLLHLAVRYGLEDATASLCRFDAPIDVRDAMERTPLHVAAQVDSGGVVLALLPNCGAELLDAKDTRGRTALHYLCDRQDERVVEVVSAFLQRSSATGIGHSTVNTGLAIAAVRNVDIADPRGDTPLHLAAAQGNGAVIIALLQAGANTACRNHKGQTPLFRVLDNIGNSHCSYAVNLLYRETLHPDIVDVSGHVPSLLSERDGPWSHLLNRLMCESKQPPSLQSICRHTIRSSIGLSNLQEDTISRLPCAPGLKNVILSSGSDL